MIAWRYYLAEVFAAEFVPRREALEELIETYAKQAGVLVTPTTIVQNMKELVDRRAENGQSVTAEKAFELLYGEQD